MGEESIIWRARLLMKMIRRCVQHALKALSYHRGRWFKVYCKSHKVGLAMHDTAFCQPDH